MRAIVQVLIASLLGAAAAVAMLATAIVQEIRVPVAGVNGAMAAVLVVVGFVVLLVLVCDTFCRHVEVLLASWRAAKRSARQAWDAAGAAERARLGLEA